ncbi:polyketide synthase [Sesbania bispinosa]|nr:polyketide synthase [Sesbania bispinosa]
MGSRRRNCFYGEEVGLEEQEYIPIYLLDAFFRSTKSPPSNGTIPWPQRGRDDQAQEEQLDEVAHKVQCRHRFGVHGLDALPVPRNVHPMRCRSVIENRSPTVGTEMSTVIEGKGSFMETQVHGLTATSPALVRRNGKGDFWHDTEAPGW